MNKNEILERIVDILPNDGDYDIEVVVKQDPKDMILGDGRLLGPERRGRAWKDKEYKIIITRKK